MFPRNPDLPVQTHHLLAGGTCYHSTVWESYACSQTPVDGGDGGHTANTETGGDRPRAPTEPTDRAAKLPDNPEAWVGMVASNGHRENDDGQPRYPTRAIDWSGRLDGYLAIRSHCSRKASFDNKMIILTDKARRIVGLAC